MPWISALLSTSLSWEYLPSAHRHHLLTRAPASSLSSSVVGVMTAGGEAPSPLSPRGQTLQMSCLPRSQTKGISTLGLEYLFSQPRSRAGAASPGFGEGQIPLSWVIQISRQPHSAWRGPAAQVASSITALSSRATGLAMSLPAMSRGPHRALERGGHESCGQGCWLVQLPGPSANHL